jgi:hypothetical protein
LQFNCLKIFYNERMKLLVKNDNAMIFFIYSATAPALLNHRDVVAAIAPCNLAAFPPSLEVNAAYA